MIWAPVPKNYQSKDKAHEQDDLTHVDLLDCMERGLSREIVADFMEPLPDKRGLWKFHVERSGDRRQYRLYCDGGAFLMYARLDKSMHRIDIFMYDPEEDECFDAQRPAFTLAANATRTEWKLKQERCDTCTCRHLPAGSACRCQDAMRICQFNASVGDGVNHCMDVCVPQQGFLSSAPSFKLMSKMPVWNEQVDSLVLDFKGRPIIPSAKNFQLTAEGDEGGRVVCQFGKLTHDKFALDFRYPLTVIQAFGICLTTVFWE